MPKRPKALKMPWALKRKKEFRPGFSSGSRTATDNSELYNSTKWRKFRRLYIVDNPLCEECKRNGKVTEGKDIDHITPIRFGGEPFDFNNLQTLCKTCHNKKSGREAHQ